MVYRPYLVEEELQLLVGQVDAGLLEAVLVELLEAEDVEDADLLQLVLGDVHLLGEQLVHLVDDPAEQAAVYRLSYGVTRV